jgi:hypothetical protein
MPADSGREHFPVMHWLRSRNRSIGVTHQRQVDHPALEDQGRFYPEERGFPNNLDLPFADCDGTDLVGDSMSDRRIDGVIRHVAFHSLIVVSRLIARRGEAS